MEVVKAQRELDQSTAKNNGVVNPALEAALQQAKDVQQRLKEALGPLSSEEADQIEKAGLAAEKQSKYFVDLDDAKAAEQAAKDRAKQIKDLIALYKEYIDVQHQSREA